MNGNLTSKLNNEAYVPILSANRAPLIGKAYSVKYTSVIKFELDVLDTYVKATYPDLRKCLNMCQANAHSGQLDAPHGDEGGSQEYKLNENTFDPDFGSSPPGDSFLDKLQKREKYLFNKKVNKKNIIKTLSYDK